MATLVLTAVGTALGGPLGGALGAMAGRAIDGAIIGSPKREGPRLKELSVTTSSYGATIPRHFGKVRAAGTVIWATDLAEHKDTSGGGKGKPKVTSYTYSVSFAVCLSSRPIRRIGRIWADGNLLRGESGALKAGGNMRVFLGDGSQPVDPLIAADVGPAICPAFRDTAYVVFEDLHLADFGNRIPALTFEIIADDGDAELVDMLGEELEATTVATLPGVIGFSHEGGSYARILQEIGSAYPLACSGSNGQLTISEAVPSMDLPVLALPSAVAGNPDEFGEKTGIASHRAQDGGTRQLSIRYYDIDRDYQPGLQRSRPFTANGVGHGSFNGETAEVEFAATLKADTARALADSAGMRRIGGLETVNYRVAELDPQLEAGSFVQIPGRAGVWQIDSLEWRETGVEFALTAVPYPLASGLVAPGSSGATRPPADLAEGATQLAAFGLPWDGTGDASAISLFAAVSSTEPGWRGAALYADIGDGGLRPIGQTSRERCVLGYASTILSAASPHVVDRENTVLVRLVSSDVGLDRADLAELALGSNKARLGDEIIQFGEAEAIGEGVWRLSTLLRGRAGTEHSMGGHAEGEPFVLLDERLAPIELSPALLAAEPAIVALSLADTGPVVTPLNDPLASVRPLSPAQLRFRKTSSGAAELTWVRRARGSFLWKGGLEVPLHEATEEYEVRFISDETVGPVWRMSEARLALDASQFAGLPPGSARKFEVRQLGAAAVSQGATLTLAMDD